MKEKQKYFLLCLLIILKGIILSESTPISGRISGGTSTTIDRHPYQLSLGYHGGYFCGASIIGEKWALTAAHCVYQRSVILITVRAGSSTANSGGTLYNLSDIYIHDNYDQSSLANDIAIVKITGTFEYDSNTQPISLPEQDEPVNAGTTAVITGWGFTDIHQSLPDVLMELEIPVVNEEMCGEEYPQYNMSFSFFCAGYEEDGAGPCSGDFGGPLIANEKQVGIASSVGSYACDEFGKLGAYTKVSKFRSWINSISGV